ncbi:polyprenol phosphomannose-dependent alpha 1,6 mannosyltransferase MptB [Corynebacterium pacaense]|uniref:polyprenol phosphomannose-dependent alpha 1,6 mannosyltransferase MptB n=1 Tax=Corynebacterium pacaense TaxID=1816684 RepID=UPI003CCBB794
MTDDVKQDPKPGASGAAAWRSRLPGPFRSIANELPYLGVAGSRSSALHINSDSGSELASLSGMEVRRFATLRYIGTVGSLMIAFGALGAGALPVVNNPYVAFPGGNLMSRMLQTSSMIVLIGVGLLVLAWVLMAPFTGVSITRRDSRPARVSIAMLRRTFVAWIAPISLTAPMFTQDIYSYLAQGATVADGLDPYSGGPLDLLGPDNHLARSVPFIWAHSPSPYGPVALGIAASISRITDNSIIAGVYGHRIVSILGVIAAGWAMAKLARRCRVSPEVAIWLGILNPLLILHLIGGIHNESLLLGLMLVGLELGLRAVDAVRVGHWRAAIGMLAASGFLISCAGMVKVTGFIALGFVGMALARELRARERNSVTALGVAILIQIVVLVVSVAAVTVITGVGPGWISGQGGAATIRSWMSMTTDIGVITGFIGMLLGLGDHTTAILTVTRSAGVLVAGAFMLRMLFATYRGRIHAVGGLGVATFVLVILFPVVHPWYLLWAILPLSAWANRLFFQIGVVAYSTAMSFFVLPRGLALPPGPIFAIYFGALIGFLLIVALGWGVMRRRQTFGLD